MCLKLLNLKGFIGIKKINYRNYLFPMAQHKSRVGVRSRGEKPDACVKAVTVTETVTSRDWMSVDCAGGLEIRGAGEGNRTLVISLGSWSNTIIRHPLRAADFLPEVGLDEKFYSANVWFLPCYWFFTPSQGQ